MKRYAVIGHPITHTLSPQIHYAFARQTGILLQYDAIDVKPEVLHQSLGALHRQIYAGLNVTLPHKTAVVSLCGQLSQSAQDANAVNVLTRTDSGWRGDNTDGDGLLVDLLKNLGISIKGKRVLLVGAGGAARGLLAPLLVQGPSALVLSNRSMATPIELARHFAALGRIIPTSHDLLSFGEFNLIINATSAGHSGKVPALPDNLFAKQSIAYDLNYGEAARPFLDWAREQGAQTMADGLGMLIEQAAAAFALWHGERPDTRPVLTALRNERLQL